MFSVQSILIVSRGVKLHDRKGRTYYRDAAISQVLNGGLRFPLTLRQHDVLCSIHVPVIYMLVLLAAAWSLFVEYNLTSTPDVTYLVPEIKLN